MTSLLPKPKHETIDVQPTTKELLSNMLVYNAFRSDTNSSTSTDSSLASCTGIKPTTEILSAFQTLDLSTLSHSYGILLIIRKFIVQGGCPFCNRRMTQINEWRKSLLQLGIVPVILHSESVEDGNLFFKELCNPQLRDIWRVSDPGYNNTIQFCSSRDSGTTPLQFTEFDKFYPIKKITKLAPVLAQGYFDPANRYKVEKNLKIEKSSLEVKARVLLIKNDRVVKTWDHEKHDNAPDVLSDVIIQLDWLARELIERKQDETVEEEDESDQDIEEGESETNLKDVQLSLNEEFDSSKYSTPPKLNILQNVNPNNEEIVEIEELNSPASPTSPTKTLNSLLETLQTNIDVYKKEKSRKYEFKKITPQQQISELKQKTEKAKQKFNDMKAKQSSKESFGCLPVRRADSNSSKKGQAVSMEDLGQSVGSLAKLIQSERKRKYLKLFSAREYNAESILFWEDVVLFYKKLFISSKLSNRKKEKIIEHSNRIATRYLLDEDSLFLLNTNKRLKEIVKDNLPHRISDLKTHPDISKAETLFDSVVSDIMAHTLSDVYIRFLFSDEFKQMNSELGLNTTCNN